MITKYNRPFMLRMVRMLTLFFIALSWAASAGAQDRGIVEGGVVVRDAWARVPEPSKMETALYMVIENHTAQKRSVVSASSDAAGKVEMHQMRMDGRIMVMLPVAEIAIPARGKASLSPNGLHMMMYRLRTRPVAGDNLNVVLKLDDGSSVPVTAAVRK
jgi:periplasmic copper chaperone A